MGTVACRGVKAVAIAALLAGVFRLTNSELVSGGLFDSAVKAAAIIGSAELNSSLNTNNTIKLELSLAHPTFASNW